jgi:hypothetical protein
MAYLTAKVGDNSDLLPDIIELYVPAGSVVADVTWGRGVFWKKRPDLLRSRRVLGSDLDRTKGDVTADFRHLPYPTGSLDALILDPPYLYVGGFKTLKLSIDAGYNNRGRALVQGIFGVGAVNLMFYQAICEAERVVKPRGILIVKCMDQVMSGKQEWQHVTVMDYMNNLGFENLDLFVLVQKGQPTMRHKVQVHARRNHSYFMVGRRRK